MWNGFDKSTAIIFDIVSGSNDKVEKNAVKRKFNQVPETGEESPFYQ
jgi:hypothetical protein